MGCCCIYAIINAECVAHMQSAELVCGQQYMHWFKQHAERSCYFFDLFWAQVLLFMMLRKGVDMKIAIPLFGTRISPRFDHAPSAMLINTDDDEKAVVDIYEMSLQDLHYLDRVKQLKASGVEVVICGGISNEMLELLRGRKIEVIPWVAGEAKEALRMFLLGKLIPGAILCPGKRMRQWGFCTQKQKRRRGRKNS